VCNMNGYMAILLPTFLNNDIVHSRKIKHEGKYGHCAYHNPNVSHRLLFNKLLSFSSITFLKTNDLNPNKPSSNDY
jgi:hypothetical protein